MSIARHHNEWLSLIEISGPFLSMPVLMRVFPQGLDQIDSSKAKELNIAYEEWSQGPNIIGHHYAWIEFILARVLEFPKELISEGQSLPPSLEVAMGIYGETLRPDMAIVGPENTPLAGKPQLLIQIYPHTQNLKSPVPGRLWKDSPATRMVELLHGTGAILGLISNGEEWTLVYAPSGETTGFATWRADIWQEERITLRAFFSLLHCRRFFGVPESDALASLFKESAQDQHEVTDQLGYQVRRAVEVLVQAFDLLDQETGRRYLAGLDEKSIYDAALTIMMRLVFLFCAEERGLLRLGEPLYDDNYAVSTLREHLREMADQQGEEILERRSDAWSRLLATFRAVHGGVEHESMRLLAYGGTLFDPDRYPFLEGRLPGTGWRETTAEPPGVNNRVVLHLLDSLQYLRVKVPGGGPTEARRISFRGLDIEQIGHVYEGLLDHTAIRAKAIILGIRGTRDAEPEISLELLEKNQVKDYAGFIEYLKEQTGRSEEAIRRDLSPEIPQTKRKKKNLPDYTMSNDFSDHSLLVACRNDEALLSRIKPFRGLIRSDDFGRPVIIHTGCIFVTKGSERRSTGTHYTPKGLTEPIIQHTFEPLVYIGPAEGNLKEHWKLRSPKEILDLKACDLAMGSGAFLVQACRYLAVRLAEAWDELEKANPGKILATPEGHLSMGDPSERLIPLDSDERLAIARRYIVDRCLYGVDINPMAVEMAKLSLWLITLQRDRPFSFLDHSLKCGDSLLGIESLKQIENFSLRPGERQVTFATSNLSHYVEEASAKRGSLEDLPSNDFLQIESKNRLYAEAEAATAKIKALADVLIAFEFRGLSGELYEEQRAAAADLAEAAMREPIGDFQNYARDQLSGRRVFHWPLEFPEVFSRGGFDALTGNPPFMGGQKISGALGTDYREYLVQHLANGRRGSADLCAYFFLRAYALLRADDGVLGLLATNTISQGQTREVGLDQILNKNSTIIRAISGVPWPGEASLEIACLWIRRGPWTGERRLGDRVVTDISAFLTVPASVSGKPYRLAANKGKSFQGTIVLGMGFVISPEEAQRLLASNPSNKAVLFPYLGGDDINSRPDYSPSRWVISFHVWPLDRSAEGNWHTSTAGKQDNWLKNGRVPRDYPGQVATDFPECLRIVEERVKPERMALKGNNPTTVRRRALWWLFGSDAKTLYQTVQPLGSFLIRALTSKYHCFVLCPLGVVVIQTTSVVAFNSFAHFALLQSEPHNLWALEYGNKLETRPQYTTSDCFETYPFPRSIISLEAPGRRHYEFRQELLKSRHEGLTKAYNRFHDSGEKSDDIKMLRRLHMEMDYAVAAAYGWGDIDLNHGFHETNQGLRYTLSESARRMVLERLLALNHKRYAEELKAGLHEKKSKAYKRNSGKMTREEVAGQGRLLPDK